MTSLQLYYSPMACSLSCHVALEESGLRYDTVEINTKTEVNLTPYYRGINPLGKVPALAIEGSILTESAAILSYIADLVPEKGLLPPAGSRARAFAHEWLNFLSSTVHVAFRPVFRPERLIDDATCLDGLRRMGVAQVIEVLKHADARFGRGPYTLGETFSLCDGYLLVFYLWSKRPQFASDVPRFPALHTMARLVLMRPAVQLVMKAEGVPIPAI
jgi:glutathione S-transferase